MCCILFFVLVTRYRKVYSISILSGQKSEQIYIRVYTFERHFYVSVQPLPALREFENTLHINSPISYPCRRFLELLFLFDNPRITCFDVDNFIFRRQINGLQWAFLGSKVNKNRSCQDSDRRQKTLNLECTCYAYRYLIFVPLPE